jgi:hypothetical protein
MKMAKFRAELYTTGTQVRMCGLRSSLWLGSVAAILSTLLLSCSSDLKVTSIDPGAGSARGGQKVVIEGKGFESDCQVTFGSTPARSVNVVSSESLEVVTPLAIAGAADVTVAIPRAARS